jgi:FkbM family methyltransferase
VTELSSGNLRDALQRLGSQPEARERFIAFLRELEPSLARDGVNVREELTGPLVDALYADGELVERTLASGMTFTFPYRSKIARDFVMAADERPDHVWEPQTTKLLLLLAANAKQVVIGGAYFGDHAIPIAHSIEAGGGVVHCFDINPEQIRFLSRNAGQNRLTNVRINPVGLFDKDDRRLALVGDDSHASSKEIPDAAPDVGFPTITIDSYARQNGFDRVDLIMLDIEGGELPALRGARRLLERAEGAPNIVFEIHRAYTDWSHGLSKTDICAFLIGLGYRVFAIRDYQGNVPMKDRPIELVPADDAYIEGPPHGFNMLAVKDERVLSRPELRIVRGVSPKLLFHRDPRLHQPQS